ncbi:MAG: LuxQ periplasmic sensor domain-containing protein [Motiliproteus sp.]
MKRSYSLFVLLGGLLLIAFLVLSASLLSFDYRNAKQTVEREINHTSRHQQALLQSVFDMHLSTLSLQLSQLVRQSTQQSNSSLLDYYQQFEKNTYQGNTDTFDMMLLASGNGRKCMDLSVLKLSSEQVCQQLVRQFDDELYRWHLFVLDKDSSAAQVGLITREPLINPNSGYILGYLYGVMLLSNNVDLINLFLSTNEQHSLAAGIALDKQLLVATAKHDSEKYTALSRLLEQGSESDYASNQYFGRSSSIPLGHEGKGRLQLVSITSAHALLQLEQDVIYNSLIALTVSVLLAAVVGLLALRITLSPLNILLNFARQGGSSAAAPLVPGRVKEFNQLSQNIAEIVTELAQTNTRLQSTIDHNKALLHQVINLQEEERKQLSQELHDDLGQSLTVVSTDAHVIRSLVPEDSPAHVCAESIYQNAQEMYDIVYNRIINLRPLPLNDLGLADAIRYMPALQSLPQQGIKIELNLDSWEGPMSDAIEINLYRIVQEAITNILKHSKAKQAWVNLAQHSESIQLEVGDDGIGFDVLNPGAWERFGLTGMQERAQSIGGSLDIGQDETGTRLLINIPVSDGDIVYEACSGV